MDTEQTSLREAVEAFFFFKDQNINSMTGPALDGIRKALTLPDAPKTARDELPALRECLSWAESHYRESDSKSHAQPTETMEYYFSGESVAYERVVCLLKSKIEAVQGQAAK